MKLRRILSRIHKILGLVVILTLLAGPLVLPSPVYAIGDPDSPPSINAVYVYEDLLEDGDTGVLIEYFLDYSISGNPTEVATDSYMAVFIDVDSTTQLKAASPYAFQDSGYGRGLIWIYFTAAETTLYSLDSADQALYSVWLTGNPTLTWVPGPDPPKTVATIDYWQTSGDAAVLLALRVLYYAEQLELTWVPAQNLIESTAIGSRLATAGVSYFTSVIANLRTMAPSAFSDVTSDPSYTPVSYDTAFGAEARSGTATIVGSPVTLTPAITLANQSFEISNPPMGWTLVGTGATFSRSTAQVESGVYSGLLTRVGTNCNIHQSIDPENYLGTNLTFGAWVYATVANRARIALDDDVGAMGFSAYHSGAAGWEFLTVTYAVAAAATTLQLHCVIDTGDTSAYFDNVALVEASNIISTGITVGTIVLDLAGWTFGTVTNMTGVVTGSPVTINPGVNTLTVPGAGAGTFFVAVGVVDTITLLDAATTGTAFDLTAAATAFRMSRWMFSGLIWMLITIIICAAVYRAEKTPDGYDTSPGGSKVVLIVFTVAVLGGTLLGLLKPTVAALLLIGCGAWVGYVLFFRSETLHKGFMFMVWMFFIVSLSGNILAGSSGVVATRLTANVVAGTVNSISVASTTGFPASGVITIGDERIGYPSKSATTFDRSAVLGVTTNPITRGLNDTEDVAHTSGDTVRTAEAGFFNAVIDYKIAQIADTAGIMGFIVLPAMLLSLILTFFILPVSFLGTDFAVLSYIWMVVAAGMIVGFVLQLAGGRRV